jgi:hypothetical protein
MGGDQLINGSGVHSQGLVYNAHGWKSVHACAWHLVGEDGTPGPFSILKGNGQSSAVRVRMETNFYKCKPGKNGGNQPLYVPNGE